MEEGAAITFAIVTDDKARALFLRAIRRAPSPYPGGGRGTSVSSRQWQMMFSLYSKGMRRNPCGIPCDA